MEFKLNAYLKRLNLNEAVSCDEIGLDVLQKHHFYTVPFENLSMHMEEGVSYQLNEVYKKIVLNNRGGNCFEMSILMAKALSELGFVFEPRLARVHLVDPISAATHQIFVVSIEKKRWILDIGFGAKGPRGPLLLESGFVQKRDYTWTKVEKSDRYGWIISILENPEQNEEWEPIYSFYDQYTTDEDIEAAQFFVTHAKTSLLKMNCVVSLPTETGRLSIRNGMFIEASNDAISTQEFNCSDALKALLSQRFNLDLNSPPLQPSTLKRNFE
ncbi:arylamine N-acetyltransferase [Vibrio parahaemolyticus]|uniref:arylamine N-acetyltransferase family protein n=1 Tax=Vibrio parahaemolyticus TaxID=670 RepID=UPI00211A457A|nr:arylamine N-acetyltransferase [Vibrio parahaemolyticus]EGR3402334.1 arylamine N-acetyltransferase [Vibrio parahaemolyticus]MCQ9041916.1 arylamine N-acetyltransferase [Vibrio parahaemolyticus]